MQTDEKIAVRILLKLEDVHFVKAQAGSSMSGGGIDQHLSPGPQL